MNLEKILEVRNEAERFIHEVAKLVSESPNKDWEITGSKLSGSVRRASLDLSRKLAEMRKP